MIAGAANAGAGNVGAGNLSARQAGDATTRPDRRARAPRAFFTTRSALRAAALLAAMLVAALAPAAMAQSGADEDASDAGDAAALPSDVAAVLAGIDDHPALRAARAGLDAARSELDAIRSPVSFEATVGATRVDATAPETTLPDPLDALQESPEGWSASAQIDARIRPFLAGDLADAEAQRRIAVQRAERTVRETRASLETAALQSAAGLLAAERGADVAERGVAVAREALGTTRGRGELGAATDAELRRAEASVARAEESLRAAEARVGDARRTLADLVGPTARLQRIPSLPTADGPDPAVLRAEEDLQLAGVGVDSAERALLPTAQAGYTWNTGDGSLGVSIESRTWQPTLSYATPGSFQQSGGLPLPDEFSPTVDGTLSLGLTFRLSPEAEYAREAAVAQRAGAEANLAAARAESARAAASRDDARNAARAELELARMDVEHARLDLDDTARRLDLGLTVPIDVAERELALDRARTAVDAALVSLLSAQLRGYRELAVPPSEVLP